MGITAARDEGADLAAEKMIGALPRLDNLARYLKAKNIGRSRRGRIEAPALEHIGPVHACRGDPDQDFILSRPWNRPLDNGKLLGSVRLGCDNGVHHGGNGSVHGGRLIDFASPWVNDSGMDLDDLFPDKPKDPLTELGKQDLDPLSIDELQARIQALKAEIARVEAHMSRAQTHRSAAEDLFKKD